MSNDLPTVNDKPTGTLIRQFSMFLKNPTTGEMDLEASMRYIDAVEAELNRRFEAFDKAAK